MNQNANKSWEWLFGKEIPFKAQIHLLFYHFPGLVAAFVIGIAVNVVLEAILSRISRRLSQSTYVAYGWIVLVIYLVFFTPFDRWLAEQIQWYRIVPRP